MPKLIPPICLHKKDPLHWWISSQWNICNFFLQEGCIRALFEICRTDTLAFAHVQSLRALATICCVAESILELEKEGGVDILAEILCDKNMSEAVRGEAAGVIAQITSPCLDNFHHIAGFLDNAGDLLQALIRKSIKWFYAMLVQLSFTLIQYL